MKTILVLFTFLIVSLCGCSWHSMYLEAFSQPIYFGTPLDSAEVDTIGIVSGLSVHEEEGETYSHTGNVSVSFGGKDYTKENINFAIKAALNDDLKRFIAKGQMVVEIEHGISTGAILSTILASIITNDNSETGHYTNELIYFRGIVYRLKNKENQK